MNDCSKRIWRGLGAFTNDIVVIGEYLAHNETDWGLGCRDAS